MNKYALAFILATASFAAQAQNTVGVPANSANSLESAAVAAPVPAQLPAAGARSLRTDASVVPAAPSAVESAVSTLPEGVVTTTHPLKLAFLTQSNSQPTVYRPNRNMPEIVNEDVMRGMREAGESPGGFSEFVGHLPKLTVLPCEKGCAGEDYEKTVAHFLRSYRGERKHFVERGEMIVQVRWFNRRGYMARQLPYGADTFGISFLYEGKLVSLGRSAGVGSDKPAERLAEEMGARLAVELAFTVGMGAKPLFVTKTTPNELVQGFMDASRAVNGMLGAEDVRSRIDPATLEAHKHLMPAIDGIEPGEVAPITETKFVYTIM